MRALNLKKLALASVLATASVLSAAADGADANALTVCLNRDNAPFSQKKDGKESGYDLMVAQAVAKQLGKTLEVKWYEKERRSRGPVSVKASVLINAGVCQLIGGYPLLQSSLDRPGAGESATLPPVEGIPAENRKQSIKGSQLFPSQPYHFAGVTPVLGARVTQQKLESLDDLKPYKIGNRPAAIGDLIAMAYKQGLLVKNVMHVDIQSEPLDALSKGEFDVTIIEAHKFDPVSQEDYYALQAVFAGVGKGEIDWEPDAAVAAIGRLAGGLPAFGIVAAVLGVVNTMGSVGQPPAVLGGMIGSALVGTFLGILLAYGFAEPLAGLLEQKVDEAGKELQCIKTTLLASMQGYAPQVAIEFGRKVLYSSERPAFAELEEHLRNAKSR